MGLNNEKKKNKNKNKKTTPHYPFPTSLKNLCSNASCAVILAAGLYLIILSSRSTPSLHSAGTRGLKLDGTGYSGRVGV